MFFLFNKISPLLISCKPFKHFIKVFGKMYVKSRMVTMNYVSTTTDETKTAAESYVEAREWLRIAQGRHLPSSRINALRTQMEAI